MVNFNGQLVDKDANFLNHQNRAFKYGDTLVERFRLIQGKIPFWEDYYFRLLASMRILRMQIPMEFTMEFLENEIFKTLDSKKQSGVFEIQIFVFRNDASTLSPNQNKVSYLIEHNPLSNPFYQLREGSSEVELFKDHYVTPGLLSTLETSNRQLEIVAEVFAKENNYDSCFLLNTNKNIVGSTKGSTFLVKDYVIKTPPLGDGVKNTVLRKKIIGVFQKWEKYDVVEESISPFELQKCDEMFICDDVMGIIPITKYRKKEYRILASKELIGKINALARVS